MILHYLFSQNSSLSKITEKAVSQITDEECKDTLLKLYGPSAVSEQQQLTPEQAIQFQIVSDILASKYLLRLLYPDQDMTDVPMDLAEGQGNSQRLTPASTPVAGEDRPQIVQAEGSRPLSTEDITKQKARE